MQPKGSRKDNQERAGFTPSGAISAFILAGKTGSGKSSFIKLLGGRDLLGHKPVVDGGLDSVTRKPTVYVTMLNGRKILLLDTPGFDDSAVEDLEVLNDIVANLYTFAIQRQEIETRGVIFLHDISETRFGGSQRKTLEILKVICGPGGMGNCVIGTTMWSNPGTDKFRKEEVRENEFLRSHWKGILNTTRLPENDASPAIGIINDILARPPVLLQVQEEMLRPPHTFENTAAGKIAVPEGRAEAEQLRRELEHLKRGFQKEQERQRAAFEHERAGVERKFELERQRQEREWKKMEAVQRKREEEQRKQYEEKMRQQDEEHQQRAEDAENERHAEQERFQRVERERWEGYAREKEEEMRREREHHEEEMRREQEHHEEKIRRARERQQEIDRRFREEQARAAEPPPPSWLGTLMKVVRTAFVALFRLG